jgi:hypothetical protein
MKKKKKKLDSIPKINRRLFRLWSEAVRDRCNSTCELCGVKKGDLNDNEVPIKIDAHHFLSRDIKDCPLKFDILNGVGVCPFCHKFGIPSFHRDPVYTITWLQENRPERYEYVLKNSSFKVDLQNRKVLEEIEARLLAKESLDLDKLAQIESSFPRQSRKKEVIPDDIFENIVDDSEKETFKDLDSSVS